jgi:hypothetical protein
MNTTTTTSAISAIDTKRINEARTLIPAFAALSDIEVLAYLNSINKVEKSVKGDVSKMKNEQTEENRRRRIAHVKERMQFHDMHEIPSCVKAFHSMKAPSGRTTHGVKVVIPGLASGSLDFYISKNLKGEELEMQKERVEKMCLFLGAALAEEYGAYSLDSSEETEE